MKYAYTLLAILLICNFSNLQAQNTRTITGRIVDANDNETLPGVGIFANRTIPLVPFPTWMEISHWRFLHPLQQLFFAVSDMKKWKLLWAVPTKLMFD